MSFYRLSLRSFLLISLLFVQPVAVAFRCEMEGKHREDFNHHKAESYVKEILTVLFNLRSEEADIDQLVDDNIECGKGHDSTLDDTHTIEFRAIYEAQVVLIDVVFEREEAHGEDWNVRHYR